MSIALLSDVHGNIEALNACLKHAAESGAERYAFLGDLVGYGADPEEVVATVARWTERGAVSVKGNHDEAIEKRAGYMNDATKESIEWTRRTLPAEGRAYLSSLPFVIRDGAMCFVHASAALPARWDYVDTPAVAQRSVEAARTTYTFSGHVHDQVLYFEGAQGKWSAFNPTPGSPVPVRGHRRWLALVGSVGQPRDGHPAAAYTLFDPARERITFYRLAYDHAAAARKIRSAGLPEAHAYRVEKGV
ncbi:MAG TPA: metallophosphoesterase family protein [Burkholderiales bacterium]|nr:metallophosphoesterase family protein [Burkholderiales bacterium]